MDMNHNPVKHKKSKVLWVTNMIFPKVAEKLGYPPMRAGVGSPIFWKNLRSDQMWNWGLSQPIKAPSGRP